MTIFHFSVKFAGSEMTYHGDFASAFVKVEDIKKKAKTVLIDKLEVWQKQAKDVVFFEIYRYSDSGNEIQIYKWDV